jgi:hypothetical protein
MSEAPIIPAKQVYITIAGEPFIAVLLPNGEAGLVFPQLCEWLGLKASTQAYLLRLHPTLSTALMLTQIETSGGPQAVTVLVAWGIPLWLERIRRGRCQEIYRERLLVVQRDAQVSLSKQFFQNPGGEPAAPKREKPSAGLEGLPSIREARQAIRRARESLAQAEE